jgi:cytochrome c oxidase subunit IV
VASVDQDQEQDAQEYHPSARQYVEIGVILAAVTAIEISLFYADVPRSITIPALLFLTAIKFALVVLWYMHLRFDHRVMARLFVAGIVIALVMFGAVSAMTLL